jgi:superfamily II DNA/RNA helicase
VAEQAELTDGSTVAVATEQEDTVRFSDLGVSGDLVSVLEDQGIVSPFPIQTLTIQDALQGEDVCGKAKTGSGKTLAFGLPLIERIGHAKPKLPQALVLVPTRELCTQVSDALEPLLAVRDQGLVSVYGGVSIGDQTKLLRDGVEVVVATPGRLIDLLDRKALRLDDIEVVVIDEADQMADMGFLPQVRKIMRQIKGEHQTLLFSATLDGQVGGLVRDYTNDPIFHEVESDTVIVDTSEHRFIQAHHMDKAKIVERIGRNADRILVFTRTKRGADEATAKLRDLGVKVAAIHGDKHQSRREKVLDDFSRGKLSTLVATNVAARGLHIEGVDIVIHYDPPDNATTYLHRSGRTARAGEEGLVVTLVEWDQVPDVQRIQKIAGIRQSIVEMFSNDDRLDDLSNWEPPPEKPKPKKKRKKRRR